MYHCTLGVQILFLNICAEVANIPQLIFYVAQVKYVLRYINSEAVAEKSKTLTNVPSSGIHPPE